MVKSNVWAQDYPGRSYQSDGSWIRENSFKRRFSELRVNRHLDIYVNRIALKASPFVVSLVIYSEGEIVCWGSGFIISCDDQFQSTIITSATLFRVDATSNILLPNLKVVVLLSSGEEYNGEIEACDLHYNLAAITIQAEHALEIARCRHVDDSIIIDPSKVSTNEKESFMLRHHSISELFRLTPGCRVIALGRYHKECDIMASPGNISIEQCRFDCKELLRSTCRITKCGIGGPLINRHAEVIGVSFFASNFTPFLPINIVSKWLKHYKEFGKYCRPWLGIEVSNLFTFEVCIWERIIQRFSDLKYGIIVDEVTPLSPASSAGVHPNDIILECDGKVVESSLQFFDLTWEKVGKFVDLVVVRDNSSRLKISVMIADVSPDQFNSWPLPLRRK